MPASVPLIDKSAINTVFDAPMILVANVAVAALVDKVTRSPVSLPTNVADPLFSNAVASDVES